MTKRSVRVNVETRHVVDRDGVVHKFLWNVTRNCPAMLSTRCQKPVATRPSRIKYTKEQPTCVLCLGDTWEP